MHHPDVYLGPIQPYEGHPSAIAKRLVEGVINLTPLGLEGDEQAEKTYHGGPDRALCHYPREHYAHWRDQFPAQAEQFCAPAFGENISTLGLTEQNVFMGDIFRWGKALIQVTQPRSPCFKLNDHLAISDISVLMQQTGCCGWLYRVVAAGTVSGDQPLELVVRNSDVSVAQAISIAWHMPFDEEQYRRLLAVSGLSASWSKTLVARITKGEIEDFNRRLLGH
ncbi:MOSC domain-containing protein [Serratia sp. S1B]|nr:MOSC domain-containing protein [Serratia sp. S1B]